MLQPMVETDGICRVMSTTRTCGIAIRTKPTPTIRQHIGHIVSSIVGNGRGSGLSSNLRSRATIQCCGAVGRIALGARVGARLRWTTSIRWNCFGLDGLGWGTISASALDTMSKREIRNRSTIVQVGYVSATPIRSFRSAGWAIERASGRENQVSRACNASQTTLCDRCHAISQQEIGPKNPRSDVRGSSPLWELVGPSDLFPWTQRGRGSRGSLGGYQQRQAPDRGYGNG